MQLPLTKGDAAFFNPALFHGAGSNVSADVQRMANLLQVSSAFGRRDGDRRPDPDRQGDLSRAARPEGTPARTQRSLDNALTCAADGYPFPTNLDLDPNVGGLTPLSQIELLQQALVENWDRRSRRPPSSTPTPSGTAASE